MDFKLTEEQKALQSLAREFATQKVRPIAQEFDQKQDPSECIPLDVVEEGSKIGLRTLALSEENGGGGADKLTLSIVGEELGAGDLGVAATFDQTWKFSPIIENWTNDEQKQRFIPKLINDHRFLLATCITEPNAGTDHVLPYPEPGSGVQMSAVKKGNTYELNGTKQYISNGGTAKLYVTYARTDKSKGGLKVITAFLVSHDTPGLEIGRIHDKMGRRLLSNGTLGFNNAEVPEENLLGEENGAESLRGSRIARGRGGYGATVLGTGRAAFEEAVKFSQERIQGGKPIAQHQAIAQMIGEMYTRIESARSVLWRASWNVDHAEVYDPKFAWLAKVFCSEASYEVCKLAIEVHGGMGYMKECPVEKYLRDVISFLHGAGNNHIFRIKMSSNITGLLTS